MALAQALPAAGRQRWGALAALVLGEATAASAEKFTAQEPDRLHTCGGKEKHRQTGQGEVATSSSSFAWV